MPHREKLIEIFEEARSFVNRTDNDFIWSGWEDATDATAEIDGVLSELRQGNIPSVATVLFLPTGPLQELATSSGWGDEYCALGDRFDAAMADSDCPCDTPEHWKDLGMDSQYGEASLLRCPTCSKVWLRYYYVNEAFSNSGRWYMGAIPLAIAEGLTADLARPALEALPEYRYGGSYFDGKTGVTHGPMVL